MSSFFVNLNNVKLPLLYFIHSLKYTEQYRLFKNSAVKDFGYVSERVLTGRGC